MFIRINPYLCHLLTRYQSTIFPNHKSCVRKKGVPHDISLFLFCPKFKNRLRHTFRADFYRNLSVFSFTPAHGYRPSVPSIAFILQIRSESFSEACLLRNVPGTLRTIGLHIKNYSVRSTAQKIDLLPDRLTTYGAKDIDGMQVIHQTVGPWTIHSFIHITTSFINP